MLKVSILLSATALVQVLTTSRDVKACENALEEYDGFSTGQKPSEYRSSLSLAAAHNLGPGHIHFAMASEQNSKFFFADINNPQHVAMVTLSRSDTVGDLKNAIQYLCYKDVNPFKIDLFQVDISDEGDLAQKIEEKKKDLGSPLLPSRRLIRYYPSTPPEDAIHILVRCSASPHDELRE
ncbi:hypothetical protein PIIN_08222 [Serendipita indica DSM 11827]|uniref:Crinkler effector protein N-terminal domain-containing protein n=1 Tax=Serendipita indica (strain DSM 11827) TaxID=1109443 RepID=G4TSH6_SERID|nr:hypothetical protein PIIN_08222 [Serendipita indica DSM 11827]